MIYPIVVAALFGEDRDLYKQAKLASVMMGVLAIVTGLQVVESKAATIDIQTQQDTSLNNTLPNTTANGPFLFVGDNSGSRDFQSMLGFDMSALTGLLGPTDSLVINSMTFSAWHNFAGDNNTQSTNVDVGIGTNDNWLDSTATYAVFGNQHSGVVNTQTLTAATVNNSYITWDLSSVSASEFLVDDYLTVFLFVDGAPVGGTNWNTFEPEEAPFDNNAYIRIDYDIVPTQVVPLPAALPLLLSALGFFGFFGWRQKRMAAA